MYQDISPRPLPKHPHIYIPATESEDGIRGHNHHGQHPPGHVHRDILGAVIPEDIGGYTLPLGVESEVSEHSGQGVHREADGHGGDDDTEEGPEVPAAHVRIDRDG